LRVTKLRPGEHTMTRASVIFNGLFLHSPA